MSSDSANLNRLMIALDDSRDFYVHAIGQLASPRLKPLMRKLIRTHASIADELAEQIQARHWSAKRKGSRRGWLRLRYAGWRARANPDKDLGYLLEVAACEARVVRQFALVIRDTTSIPELLQVYEGELERAHSETELWAHQLLSRNERADTSRLSIENYAHCRSIKPRELNPRPIPSWKKSNEP